MSATAAGPPQATPPAVAETKLNASDLAELMATFSAASDQLQATHVRLQSEVERLRGELLETKGQLRRAQQLAALGEMAAGIAHEIRNPLGSIKLYCSALIDDLGPMPQQQGMARKVAGAVDRLNAVVGDVLAFSREMKVSKIATSTHELLDLAVECCEGDAAMFEVQFDCAYRRRTDTPAWCDATLMRQALVNVIRNACEAASESSGQRIVSIDLDKRQVRTPEGGRAPMLGLRINDSGPGIPADVQPRMFVPFFTTREAGTGLGLAIVHRILDAHDGRVDIQGGGVQSSLPGAVVELLLPTIPDSDHAHGEAA